MIHPSSDVHGGRLALRADRGGMGSLDPKVLLWAGRIGVDGIGLRWRSRRTGRRHMWWILNVSPRIRVAGGASGAGACGFINKPNTTPDTRSCRRARSDVGSAVRAGTMESSECSRRARSACADVGPWRAGWARAVPDSGGKDAWAPEPWLPDIAATERLKATDKNAIGKAWALGMLQSRQSGCMRTKQTSQCSKTGQSNADCPEPLPKLVEARSGPGGQGGMAPVQSTGRQLQIEVGTQLDLSRQTGRPH